MWDKCCTPNARPVKIPRSVARIFGRPSATVTNFPRDPPTAPDLELREIVTVPRSPRRRSVTYADEMRIPGYYEERRPLNSSRLRKAPAPPIPQVKAVNIQRYPTVPRTKITKVFVEGTLPLYLANSDTD
jgi:hypothetical protein